MSSAVFVIRRFLDATACAAVRRAMDRGTMDPAEVLADEIERQDEVRRAASVEVDSTTLAAIEERLDEQRETIGAFFDTPLIGREGTSFLRYGEGSFYRQHTDRGHLPSWPAAAMRQITVVVFLNAGEYRGGVLRLDGTDISAEAGMLVAFSAATPHEVTVVTAGTRDTVVDWFY